MTRPDLRDYREEDFWGEVLKRARTDEHLYQRLNGYAGREMRLWMTFDDSRPRLVPGSRRDQWLHFGASNEDLWWEVSRRVGGLCSTLAFARLGDVLQTLWAERLQALRQVGKVRGVDDK